MGDWGDGRPKYRRSGAMYRCAQNLSTPLSAGESIHGARQGQGQRVLAFSSKFSIAQASDQATGHVFGSSVECAVGRAGVSLELRPAEVGVFKEPLSAPVYGKVVGFLVSDLGLPAVV